MDLRTLQIVSVVEAVQRAVSAGAKAIDISAAARLAGVHEPDIVAAEIEILLASVLNSTE